MSRGSEPPIRESMRVSSNDELDRQLRTEESQLPPSDFTAAAESADNRPENVTITELQIEKLAMTFEVDGKLAQLFATSALGETGQGSKKAKAAKAKLEDSADKQATEAKPGDLVATDYVSTSQGEIPIILTAPHGGSDEVPGVPERKGIGLSKDPSVFFVGRDGNTDVLTAEISISLQDKLGKKPYVVIAKFHRKYIDASRPPEIAYEVPQAKPVYDAFHAAIAKYCVEVQKKFGRGLLLDVHGQGEDVDKILRGTRDGKTVELLRQRFGETAHNGPKSLFGFLKAQGLTVFPEPVEGAKEKVGFSGGLVVQTYGSHTSFGIDAIQLEFGFDYRKQEVVKETAAKTAAAIAEFSKLYLPDKPSKPAKK